MRVAKRILAALILAAWAGLSLPGRSTLEIHDVQDLVYSLDGPGVDITLAGEPDDNLYYRVIGMELAAKLEWFVPDGQESSVHFSNGLIFIRATPLQQLAISAALTTYRAGVRTAELAYEKSRKLLRAAAGVHEHFGSRRPL